MPGWLFDGNRYFYPFTSGKPSMKPTPLLLKTARLISLLGHPLLTLPVLTSYFAFRDLPVRNAAVISLVLIGGVVLPITWQNYRKVKQGQYTNFDVSNRRQRVHFYGIALGLASAATALLWLTDQPRPYRYGFACGLGLLLISYGVNFVTKASLHTSLSTFLVWALALVSPPLSVAMAVFAVLIAASRLVLGRHTLPEVLVGALLGAVAGAVLFGLVAGF